MCNVISSTVDERKPFVSITQGLRGFFAVLYWWNNEDGEGFYEPWNTGFGSYRTREAAIPEAKQWAEAEGIEFKLNF